MPLKKTGVSISDRVYADLCDRIQFCELMPGSIIDEKALIQEFGVSRTPIREAIGRLHRQQLIDVYPQSKTLVSKIDFKQIADIVYLRSNMDKLVYASLCAQKSPLNALVDKYLALEEIAIKAADWKDAVSYDYKFHGELYRLAGHGFIWDLIERELMPCYTRIRFFSEMGHIDYLRKPCTHDEHGFIADSIRRGDFNAILEHGMERHETGFIHQTFLPYIQKYPECFVNVEGVLKSCTEKSSAETGEPVQ